MGDQPRSGCPINAAVEAFGDSWSLLVLRDVMFGDKRHFRELLAGSEEGIASNILADRLKRLVRAGLLTREDAGPGRRAAYSLTEASIQLVPVFAQLGDWGLRHRPTTERLRVRAELLSAGGPELWERFMAELRATHLGRAAPESAGPTVRELMADAYAAAHRGAGSHPWTSPAGPIPRPPRTGHRQSTAGLQCVVVSDEWTVEQVKAGVVPVWKISAPAGDSFGAPLVLCRTGEAQAVAWAQRHRSTPRTVVEIRWWNMRISADWVLAVTADILLAAALRVPGVVGAEAGSASEEWVVGLYGDVAADGSAGLEEAIRAQFVASPFTFDGAEQATVPPLPAGADELMAMMSDYRKYVAWTL